MFFRALGDVEVQALEVQPEYGAEADGAFLPFRCKTAVFAETALPKERGLSAMLYVYRNYEVQIDIKIDGRKKRSYPGFCTKREFTGLAALYAAN